jgi:hypothetical protein
LPQGSRHLPQYIRRTFRGAQCLCQLILPSFCGVGVGHCTNSCPKRDFRKVNEHSASFMEYTMTSADDHTHLVMETEKNMVMTRKYETCPAGLYGQLCVSNYTYLFEIKKIIVLMETMLISIDMLSTRQLVFKVDLIDCGGKVNKRIQGAWVTGSVMVDLIIAAERSQKNKI